MGFNDVIAFLTCLQSHADKIQVDDQPGAVEMVQCGLQNGLRHHVNDSEFAQELFALFFIECVEHFSETQAALNQSVSEGTKYFTRVADRVRKRLERAAAKQKTRVAQLTLGMEPVQADEVDTQLRLQEFLESLTYLETTVLDLYLSNVSIEVIASELNQSSRNVRRILQKLREKASEFGY